jgi:hypothetical protein
LMARKARTRAWFRAKSQLCYRRSVGHLKEGVKSCSRKVRHGGWRRRRNRTMYKNHCTGTDYVKPLKLKGSEELGESDVALARAKGITTSLTNAAKAAALRGRLRSREVRYKERRRPNCKFQKGVVCTPIGVGKKGACKCRYNPFGMYGARTIPQPKACCKGSDKACSKEFVEVIKQQRGYERWATPAGMADIGEPIVVGF